MSAAGAVIDCRGEIVEGDTIHFVEVIFERFGYSGMEVVGKRAVTAMVAKSNTSKRGTRTLTLQVIKSSGHEALANGVTVRRQSAKLDQGTVDRDFWADEASRVPMAAAARGDAAGAMRAKEEQRARARKNLKVDASDWAGDDYQDDDAAEFQRQRAELLAQAAEYEENSRREQYWQREVEILHCQARDLFLRSEKIGSAHSEYCELQDQIKRVDEEASAAQQKAIWAEPTQPDEGGAA